MARVLRSVALGASALGVLAGVGLAGTSLVGGSNLPGPERSLTTAPARADLVAPAPEAYSSVVVTRDWQEVDTSGSRLTPRGSSPTNSGSSSVPPLAPLLAESASDSVPAGVALAATTPAASTGTASSAAAPRSGDATAFGSPAAGTTDTANPAATYLAVLQATIAQSEQSKDKLKTKSSKKAPRGTADRARP